jgi:hypothetical protein
MIADLFVRLTPEDSMAIAPPIDQATLDALVAKVGLLQTDKKSADDATAASTAAHTTLTKALADAASADSAESQADAKVSADVADLKSFIDGLVPTPPPAPPVG